MFKTAIAKCAYKKRIMYFFCSLDFWGLKNNREWSTVYNDLFPHQISKLGTCVCNMCTGCVKQNFEVAIREKHVRNWCCPVCEQPPLDDEQMAHEYFEFLALLVGDQLKG